MGPFPLSEMIQLDLGHCQFSAVFFLSTTSRRLNPPLLGGDGNARDWMTVGETVCRGDTARYFILKLLLIY